MTRAKSGTLTPNVVTTVTVSNVHPNGLEIINRSGTGTIWYRLDGVDPVVAGDGSHPILGSRRIDDPKHVVAREKNAVQVLLISTEALAWTIETDPIWVYTEES